MKPDNTPRLYKYVGDGAGVPGLPYEITDAEAARTGVKELLSAAILNGNYAPAGMSAPTQDTTGSISLADGVDDAEATLAGKALAKRKKEG